MTSKQTIPHKGAKKISLIVGVCLITLGLLLIMSVFIFPAQSNIVYYNAKTKISESLQKMVDPQQAAEDKEANPDDLPVIKLGGAGGSKEVDACTGEFIEMVEYGQVFNIPWFSAHNNCEGQNILPLQKGDRFIIENKGVYVVTDFKETRKDNTYVSDIKGINGDIILQTCYWNSSLMKIIAAKPVMP